MYICRIHSKEVMAKIIPKMSLRMGMIGLVVLNFSQRLNIQNSYSMAKYLALNYVILPVTVLWPRHRYRKPPYQLAFCYSSFSFISSPFFSRDLIALVRLILFISISLLLLALGLNLNWLIVSIGSAMSPTPAKIVSRIHPKKEVMAITQTANDVSIWKVMSLADSEAFQLFKSASSDTTAVEVIAWTGKSAYLRKLQLMNKSSITDILAKNVQANDLRNRLQMPQSLSVSQKNRAQGRRKHTNTISTRYRKYQKLFMSSPPGAKPADSLATSSGTSRACAWKSVEPMMMSTLQYRELKNPLSSVCSYTFRMQILTAIRTATNISVKITSKAFIILGSYVYIQTMDRMAKRAL